MSELEERQLAADLVEGFLNLQVEENMDLISEYCTENEENIIKALKYSFAKLLSKGIFLQNEGIKGKIGYLAISFLRTFIMDGDYRLRLDLYDKSYFLDKVECSEYLDIGFILKYIDSDVELLMNEFKECGIRYREYEIEELKKTHIDTYIDIIHEFLMKIITNILETEGFNQLNKAPGYKIIFGEYLDRTVTIYDSESESGG